MANWESLVGAKIEAHRKMNPEVAKLMDAGMSERSAYRHAAATNPKKKEPNFDYERETPKGEWV